MLKISKDRILPILITISLMVVGCPYVVPAGTTKTVQSTPTSDVMATINFSPTAASATIEAALTTDRPIAILSLEELVGEWQLTWNAELVVVAISGLPKIGEVAGTIGYLYKDEKYHCGIDIWYAGFNGVSHRFNAKPDSANYTSVAGRSLAPCSNVGITPFDYYELLRLNNNIVLKQYYHDEEISSIALKRIDNSGDEATPNTYRIATSVAATMIPMPTPTPNTTKVP